MQQIVAAGLSGLRYCGSMWWRRRPAATDPEDLPTRAVLAQCILRIEVLEAQFPAYRIEMAGLADNCEEILGRAKKHKDRSRIDASRAENARNGGPGGEPDYNSEEWRDHLTQAEGF